MVKEGVLKGLKKGNLLKLSNTNKLSSVML